MIQDLTSVTVWAVTPNVEIKISTHVANLQNDMLCLLGGAALGSGKCSLHAFTRFFRSFIAKSTLSVLSGSTQEEQKASIFARNGIEHTTEPGRMQYKTSWRLENLLNQVSSHFNMYQYVGVYQNYSVFAFSIHQPDALYFRLFNNYGESDWRTTRTLCQPTFYFPVSQHQVCWR